MFAHTIHTAFAFLALADTASAPAVRVDTSATQITVTVSGLRIPAGDYNSHAEQRASFTWPATGWMRGYRIDVLDSMGRLLPRATLHHAGIVNPDRRQLAYPLAERLIAAGRETRPVTLPGYLGVPMVRDQQLVAYFMLVNPGDVDIEGAALRISFPWTPQNAPARPKDTFPVFLDANPAPNGARSFDLSPGLSVTSAEFTIPVGGRMRALGAHLHDYAKEIRLEEVESGRTLVRLRTDRARDGSVRGVEMAKFPFTRGGLRLEAGRRYRVVAVYENPTGETIADGAMAFMAGPFVPDEASRWPQLDKAHPRYVADPATSGSAAPATHAGHGGHSHGKKLPRG
jgi:hypothetical protein